MLSPQAKQLTGEKYIYLLMGYTLAKQNHNAVTIGKDNSYIGGQRFCRAFEISQHNGLTLLIERKNNASFTGLSRCFKIVGKGKRPNIYEYINEDGENCSKRWAH